MSPDQYAAAALLAVAVVAFVAGLTAIRREELKRQREWDAHVRTVVRDRPVKPRIPAQRRPS